MCTRQLVTTYPFFLLYGVLDTFFKIYFTMSMTVYTSHKDIFQHFSRSSPNPSSTIAARKTRSDFPECSALSSHDFTSLNDKSPSPSLQHKMHDLNFGFFVI